MTYVVSHMSVGYFLQDKNPQREVRTFSWTRLCRQSQAGSILKWAHCPERYLDALLIVPPDILIDLFHELCTADIAPVPVVVHFVLQSAEVSFTRTVESGDISTNERGNVR